MNAHADFVVACVACPGCALCVVERKPIKNGVCYEKPKPGAPTRSGRRIRGHKRNNCHLDENFLNNSRGDLYKDLTQVNFAETASFFVTNGRNPLKGEEGWPLRPLTFDRDDP